MSFYYADYKIWWKLKRLTSQFEYLSSKVATLTSHVETIVDQQVHEGTADPNVSVFRPTNLTIPHVYIQKLASGQPAHTWYWNVPDQTWY